MLILAIDTSSKTGSVCIFDTEKKLVLAEINLQVNLNHSDTLMTTINQLFKFSNIDKKSIDKIAVSIGPGSFTGIRVGVGTAKGLAYSLKKTICGINELDALANMLAYTEFLIMPLIDARKERVYYSTYKYKGREKQEKLSDYSDGSLRDVLEEYKNQKIIFTGNASVQYRELIEEIMGKNAYFNKLASSDIKASSLAEMAVEKEDDVHIIEPFYISKSQAERMKKK